MVRFTNMLHNINNFYYINNLHDLQFKFYYMNNLLFFIFCESLSYIYKTFRFIQA